MGKAGRPTKYSEEIADQICDLIERGLSRARASQYIGITEESLRNWCEKHPDFLTRLTRAEIECEKYHLDRIHTATTGSDQPDWKASAWLLARKWPEKYSEKIRQEISGPNGGPIEFIPADKPLSEMTPDERAARKAYLQSILAGN